MQTTLLSLLGIYVSLGGELTDTYEDIADGIAVCDYVTIPDALQAIAKLSGSTLELPKVSSADNGDLLTVVSGEWKKAEPAKELPAVTGSDNGKVLGVANGAWSKVDAPSDIVTYEFTTSSKVETSNASMPAATFSLTGAKHDEIIANVNAGKIVRLHISVTASGAYVSNLNLYLTGGQGSIPQATGISRFYSSADSAYVAFAYIAEINGNSSSGNISLFAMKIA